MPNGSTGADSIGDERYIALVAERTASTVAGLETQGAPVTAEHVRSIGTILSGSVVVEMNLPVHYLLPESAERVARRVAEMLGFSDG